MMSSRSTCSYGHQSLTICYHVAAKKALQGSSDTAQALERLIQGLQDPTSEGGSEQPSSPAAATEDSAANASLADSPESMDLDPRDEEMEEEIAREITGDPYAEYDIEVSKEGDAISEYLGLLNSSCPQA